MLITPAFAQSGGFAEGGLGLMPIILVMIIFYFLLIRPQQKRAKQHKEMLAAVRRGDKIVTNGGIIAVNTSTEICAPRRSTKASGTKAARIM